MGDFLTVLIDSREKSEVKKLGLKKFKNDSRIETLLTGDVLVNGCCIERKRIDDLISSVIDKRLKKQLFKMAAYEFAVIIIEGELEYLRNSDPRYRKYDQKWLDGLCFSIMLNYGIFVYQVKTNTKFWGAVERCKFKSEHKKHIENSKIYTPKISAINKKRPDLSMLCASIEGISETKGLLILEKYTPYELYHVSVEQLLEIKGVGPVMARRIKTEFKTPLPNHGIGDKEVVYGK